ncbi:MAG TPA: precorrin-3B synthase [Paraburkholderia sp.]
MAPASAAGTAPFALRASACPGLLRIVAAGDGGLCRIKLPGGALSTAQAFAIADAAQAHASGVIEATNRANLQLRGIRAGHESALTERLLAAGLGPGNLPDTTRADTWRAAADDVRNLMISPTAGRDLQALIDTTDLASQILTLLQTETRFAALSPKFALLLDGGERLAMLEHPHDIWLAAMPTGDGPQFAFGLAGCPPVALQHASALAAVLPSQVPTLIGALLHTFLDCAAPDAKRMRDLLAVHPAQAVLQHVEARVDFPLLRGPQIAAWRRPPADAARCFGAHPQRVAGTWHVGGRPPLGRIDAPMLRDLASLARDAGNGTLRITPWQSVLFPDIATEAVPSVLARLSASGLACERTQPSARLIACVGSAGCAKGFADTQSDARQLAARLPAAAEVHLSGCERSCAAARRVPFTLLAVAPGRYDLYQRADAAEAHAQAEANGGFGACIARHLTIEQAADLLDRLARSPLDA